MTQENNIKEDKRTPGLLVAFLFFGGVAALVVAIALLFPSDTAPEAVATTTTAAESGTPSSVDVNSPSFLDSDEPVADAAEVILPSVVLIETDRGLGSGVIYDSDGYIVTAAHVVEGADTLRVRFSDGEQVAGTVVGIASEVDIAVVHVDRTGLTAATFNQDKPRVGQLAVAVGSPWGLESTVTAGIISAVDQTNCSNTTCSSMVQTDAAINPGNSGGALVDRNGDVVGINVSIFSTSGANDGVGFAVPSYLATLYADSIISGDPLETAFLGVTGTDVNTEGRAGASITQVVAGSPAEAAGIEVGDVVTSVDGVPILGFEDLVAQIRSHQPGQEVELAILRDGSESTMTVTLGVSQEQLG